MESHRNTPHDIVFITISPNDDILKLSVDAFKTNTLKEIALEKNKSRRSGNLSHESPPQ